MESQNSGQLSVWNHDPCIKLGWCRLTGEGCRLLEPALAEARTGQPPVKLVSSSSKSWNGDSPLCASAPSSVACVTPVHGCTWSRCVDSQCTPRRSCMCMCLRGLCSYKRRTHFCSRRNSLVVPPSSWLDWHHCQHPHLQELAPASPWSVRATAEG